MNILNFMNEQMGLLALPYEFGEWSDTVRYPYFVGEITDEEPETEDGLEMSTFILNGFHRGKLYPLEDAKEKIKKHFDPIHGIRAAIDGGAIAVFYASTLYIPTNEADLKRIQINLKIKKWKGA